MKRLLISLWLLLPVLLLLVHLTNGKRLLERDRIQSVIREARAAGHRADHAKAADLFAEAAEALRAEAPDTALRLDLHKARAEARQGKLGTASGSLDRILADPAYQQQSAAFRQDVHEAAGGVRYYAAWRMRLDNAPRRDWMAQADLARRHFRLLAESRLGKAPQSFTTGQMENLEAAIRLQRMGLEELKAKPLPGGMPMGGPGGDNPMPMPGPGENEGKQGDDGPPSPSPGGTRDDEKTKGPRGNKGMRDAPPAEGKGF